MKPNEKYYGFGSAVIVIILGVILFSGRAEAQAVIPNSGAPPPTVSIAGAVPLLGSCTDPILEGARRIVDDGADATDCTVGSGSDVHECRCDGAVWAVPASGGGSPFTPGSDPETNHSGFDEAVKSDVDLTGDLTAVNSTPSDEGDPGFSIIEWLKGLDNAIVSLFVPNDDPRIDHPDIHIGTDPTVDLEEETHANEHAVLGNDRINTESLGTSGVAGTAPVSIGTFLLMTDVETDAEADAREAAHALLANVHHVPPTEAICLNTTPGTGFCQVQMNGGVLEFDIDKDGVFECTLDGDGVFSCVDNDPNNLWSIFDNAGGTATCAAQGTAGKFTTIDIGVGSALELVVCNGTTELASFHHIGLGYDPDQWDRIADLVTGTYWENGVPTMGIANDCSLGQRVWAGSAIDQPTTYRGLIYGGGQEFTIINSDYETLTGTPALDVCWFYANGPDADANFYPEDAVGILNPLGHRIHIADVNILLDQTGQSVQADFVRIGNTDRVGSASTTSFALSNQIVGVTVTGNLSVRKTGREEGSFEPGALPVPQFWRTESSTTTTTIWHQVSASRLDVSGLHRTIRCADDVDDIGYADPLASFIIEYGWTAIRDCGVGMWINGNSDGKVGAGLIESGYYGLVVGQPYGVNEIHVWDNCSEGGGFCGPFTTSGQSTNLDISSLTIEGARFANQIIASSLYLTFTNVWGEGVKTAWSIHDGADSTTVLDDGDAVAVVGGFSSVSDRYILAYNLTDHAWCRLATIGSTTSATCDVALACSAAADIPGESCSSPQWDLGTTGTVTTGSTATVLQAGGSPGWTTDEWVGYGVRNNTTGEMREITANDADSLTSAAWNTTPADTETFSIGDRYQLVRSSLADVIIGAGTTDGTPQKPCWRDTDWAPTGETCIYRASSEAVVHVNYVGGHLANDRNYPRGVGMAFGPYDQEDGVVKWNMTGQGSTDIDDTAGTDYRFFVANPASKILANITDMLVNRSTGASEDPTLPPDYAYTFHDGARAFDLLVYDDTVAPNNAVNTHATNADTNGATSLNVLGNSLGREYYLARQVYTLPNISLLSPGCVLRLWGSNGTTTYSTAIIQANGTDYGPVLGVGTVDHSGDETYPWIGQSVDRGVLNQVNEPIDMGADDDIFMLVLEDYDVTDLCNVGFRAYIHLTFFPRPHGIGVKGASE